MAVQVPVQFAWVVTVQLPSCWQQDPVGRLQGFGVQVVLIPCQMLGVTQPDWVVTVQLPVFTSQHAPTGTPSPEFTEMSGDIPRVGGRLGSLSQLRVSAMATRLKRIAIPRLHIILACSGLKNRCS